MFRNGKYIVKLHNMKKYVVRYEGNDYVFIPVLSQKLKNIDSPDTSTVYRRWFQLLQFTLNVREVYGVQALDITEQTRKNHSESSILFEISNESGEDSIVSL